MDLSERSTEQLTARLHETARESEALHDERNAILAELKRRAGEGARRQARIVLAGMSEADREAVKAELGVK